MSLTSTDALVTRLSIRPVLAAAVLLAAFISLALSTARADTFTLDPVSPTLPVIPAGPADLLYDVPGPLPSVGYPMPAMGLTLGDVVDAISDGLDPVLAPHTDYFSVNRSSTGVAGSGVFTESTVSDTPPGFTPGQAGDIFVSSPALLGTNILAPPPFGWTLGTGSGDEANIGLITPTLPGAGDDVNAYDLATIPSGAPVFFSLAAGSPTLVGLGATPADVLAVGGGFGPAPVVFLPALALGLPAGVALEMDALALTVGAGGVFLGPGSIEYSLSSATAALVGFSGADILGLSGVGTPIIVHPFGAIGLLPTDDVNALDVDQQIIVPEPGSMILLSIGALAVVAQLWRRRKQAA